VRLVTALLSCAANSLSSIMRPLFDSCRRVFPCRGEPGSAAFRSLEQAGSRVADRRCFGGERASDALCGGLHRGHEPFQI